MRVGVEVTVGVSVAVNVCVGVPLAVGVNVVVLVCVGLRVGVGEPVGVGVLGVPVVVGVGSTQDGKRKLPMRVCQLVLPLVT